LGEWLIINAFSPCSFSGATQGQTLKRGVTIYSSVVKKIIDEKFKKV